MILNNFISDSANEIAREIAKGSRFTVLRQPMEKHPQKWAEKLELLCQRVDQLEDRFERGDCLDRTLLERAQNRLDKIAAQIPKKWFFKSEGQKKTEKAQSVIRGLLAPDAQAKRHARLQKITHKESGLFIPKITSVAAAVCFLLANGVAARPMTPEGAMGLQRFSPSCDYTPEDVLMLRGDVHRSVQESRLFPVEGTSSGAYVAYDADHRKLAVVKPVDERNAGPQNKEAARRKDDLSEEDQHQLNYYPGNPAKRQFAARRLDFGSVACQPPGYIDEMGSDQFFSVEAEKAGHPAGIQRKQVYVQQFISGATPLVELHPDFPQDPTKAYKIESNPVLDQVPLEEFQKVALLDLLLYNEDRHPGNLLISKDAAGKPHLIPIDMDMILPGTFQKAPRIGLFAHQRAEERLTSEALAWIQALNPEQVASVIREEGLAEPLARQGKMLAFVLKELGPDHSIAEISQFIFSKLPHLAELSRKNALKQFSPSDLESYQKNEILRRDLWEKRGISSEDEAWYKAYQVDNLKQKIETLLEEKTFAYFKRGLQREASAIRARKTRHITFGTTYVAGNPDRDALSKLVSDNQQEYAQYWSLNGKVVTESLLQGRCQGATGFVDCAPYWNKVAILKEWLEQSSSGKEEWYVLADDDMPITNMNINPYEAIDLLREGNDASLIVARDVVQWKKGEVRDHSVNTGVLIVRRDQNSKEFIEKLWAKRNDAAFDSSHCRTLGTCKTQDVLHEQEAFARVLAEDPSLLNRVVKVVNYRNRYQGREIALNTFRRHGCFIRVQDGWRDKPFSYKDPADGAWQEGDWMGQTAGVPIIGKECGTEVPRSFRLDYLRPMLERAIPIDAEVSSSRTSQPVSTPETAVIGAAANKLTYDQELLKETQTTLGRKGYRGPIPACRGIVCSWPQDYIERVKTLAQDKNFEEAGKVISQLQSTSIREAAEQVLDASLLKRIKHLLTKTKYNLKYDASKSSDCRGCYWPENLEQTIEKMVAQISNTDVKKQARKSIEQAWVQHNKLRDNTRSEL